jgi:hypothetical protein
MLRPHVFAAIACFLSITGCSLREEPLALPPLTQDEAVALIMNLPESKAWAAMIEKVDHGEVHAAYMPDGTWKRPPMDFWVVCRAERHPDHNVRNETFLIDKTSRAVFVYDDLAPLGQDVIPRAQWQKKQPQ